MGVDAGSDLDATGLRRSLLSCDDSSSCKPWAPVCNSSGTCKSCTANYGFGGLSCHDPAAPFCKSNGRCASCSADGHCPPALPFCFNGSCSSVQCHSNFNVLAVGSGTCPADKPICQADGLCGGCTSDEECVPEEYGDLQGVWEEVCNYKGICQAPCDEDSDCTGNDMCEVSSGRCIATCGKYFEDSCPGEEGSGVEDFLLADKYCAPDDTCNDEEYCCGYACSSHSDCAGWANGNDMCSDQDCSENANCVAKECVMSEARISGNLMGLGCWEGETGWSSPSHTDTVNECLASMKIYGAVRKADGGGYDCYLGRTFGERGSSTTCESCSLGYKCGGANSLFVYTNRLERPYTYQDGCTDIPDTIFHSSCNRHDICYNTCAHLYGRKVCDDQFWWDVLSDCSIFGVPIGPCGGTATAFRLGVTAAGKPSGISDDTWALGTSNEGSACAIAVREWGETSRVKPEHCTDNNQVFGAQDSNGRGQDWCIGVGHYDKNDKTLPFPNDELSYLVVPQGLSCYVTDDDSFEHGANGVGEYTGNFWGTVQPKGKVSSIAVWRTEEFSSFEEYQGSW